MSLQLHDLEQFGLEGSLVMMYAISSKWFKINSGRIENSDVSINKTSISIMMSLF